MKRLILIGVSLFFVFCINAQGDKKSVINNIKKSDKYIYAEATMSSKEEAYALAEEILFANINEYIEQNKKTSSANIIVRNYRNELTSIDLPRGNMIRAFLYVEKEDILSADNVVILDKKVSPPEEVKKITENDLSSQEQTPQPAEEEVTIQERSLLPPEIFEKVTAISVFSEIQNCLESLNKAGKITHYDKYAAIKDNSTSYYLIVYNREGQVVALLGQGETKRLNLQTGQEDSLANYKGCGAICFKIK
ncbi:hypothetical protein LJC39_00195 [Parabacteroides sp. OttesenSCG-928-B22]|nr:hypothetical protein [Parabacteroides sp. OttesenSCG-928-B22]